MFTTQVFIATLLFAAALSANWYISPLGNDNTGDGSASLPLQTITTAMLHASKGDTIFLMQGVYTGSKNVGIRIQKDLVIRSLDGPQRTTIMANPTTTIFLFSPNVSVSLRDLTFSAANAAISTSQAPGITLNISNCVIASSSSGIQLTGPGMVSIYSSVIVRNNQGISCTGGGTLIIVDSEITQNTQSSGISCGIDSSSCAIYLTRTTVSSNNCLSSTGGISLQTGSLLMVDSSLVNNAGLNGGGFDCRPLSSVSFINTTIADNRAINGAAGRCSPTCYLSCENCTLRNNTSTGNDGGCNWSTLLANLSN